MVVMIHVSDVRNKLCRGMLAVLAGHTMCLSQSVYTSRCLKHTVDAVFDTTARTCKFSYRYRFITYTHVHCTCILYSRPVRSIQFLFLHIKYNTYLYFSIICINNFYNKIVTFGHEAFKV